MVHWQITFILWIIPKHFCSNSLYFFLVDLSPCSTLYFFFFTKFLSSLKGVHFLLEVLGCGFVSDLCIVFVAASTWLNVLGNMFIDRYFKVVLEMWVHLCTCFFSASFCSNVVCFKIRNPLLGKIFVICHVLNIVGVKPNCQLVILSFMAKIAIQPVSYLSKMPQKWLLQKGIHRKEGCSENYPDMTFILSFFL